MCYIHIDKTGKNSRSNICLSKICGLGQINLPSEGIDSHDNLHSYLASWYKQIFHKTVTMPILSNRLVWMKKTACINVWTMNTCSQKKVIEGGVTVFYLKCYIWDSDKN